MASRNRVAPTGEIVSSPLRGQLMGNRGCLHRDREVVRPWQGRRWITCVTSFKDRHLQQWAPGRYTVLFFHDEAVALAAGHRPCAECRRADYNAFREAWHSARGPRRDAGQGARGRLPGADEVDAALHVDRLDGRTQRLHRAAWATLPDGTFVRTDDGAAVVVGAALVNWSSDHGYGAATKRPRTGQAEVMTPAITVAVLRAGYAPLIAVPPGG